MTISTSVTRIFSKHLGDARTVCLGTQIALILNVLRETIGDIKWYCTDIETNDSSYFLTEQEACDGMDTETLIQYVEKVNQFLSGVFIAVPASVGQPLLRWCINTEDELLVELGDALIEIRAFDTTYIEVIATSPSFLTPLVRYFGVGIENIR